MDVVSALLPRLAMAGYAVWWDRWSGPRRLADEQAPSRELASMLDTAIDRAFAALIVLGASYHKGHWTAHEYAAIKRRGIPRVEIMDSKLRSAGADGGFDELIRDLKSISKRSTTA